MLIAAREVAASKLCIAGVECVEAGCGHRVPASDARRLFTLALTNTIYLGTLNARERLLSCDGYGELTLRVAAKLPKRTIARLSVAPPQGEGWELKLDADQLRKPVTLRIAPGTYRIAVEAPHFVRARSSVTVVQKPAVATLSLQPAPTLSAVVRDRGDRAPRAGALITTDRGESPLSDTEGRFSLEPDPEKWPAALTITAPGHAPTTLAVPNAHAGKSFDDVLLGRGATIIMKLTGAEATATVELHKLQSGAMVAGPAMKSMAAAETLTFDNVEPGDYDLMVKGNGVAERRGEVISVADGEVKHVAIDIVPFRLQVRAQYQGEPLREASIRLLNLDGRWEGRFNTDSDGKATVQLWQGGKASLTLGAPAIFTAPYVERRELPREDSDWLVDVPGFEITGVVIDAASGEPIAGASVLLATPNVASRTKTGADGHFRYAPAAYGSHTLRTVAKGYLPAEMKYMFREPETHRELTIRLERAASVTVAVIDSRGAPVGGARLAVFRGPEFLVFGVTDDSGVGEVPQPIDQAYDVYAVPRDGSFGVAQVIPKGERTAIRIPDGVSRIVLKSESESHQPIPRVIFRMRYNGRLLPDAVLKAIGDLQGVRMWTGTDGVIALDRMPVGLYEFWPAGAAADAAARVSVAPGDNVATMILAPAH